MISVTDIKGIGPAKAETLEEEGYESVEDIAAAEQDELVEVSGISEDRSLEYIVSANDLIEGDDSDEGEASDEFDLTPSEVSDELEGEEDEEEDEEEELDEDDDELEEEEPEEDPEFDVTITFDERLEYDVYHAALMRRHEDMYTSHQPTADALQSLISGLESFDSVSYELTEYELNTLHTAVKSARSDYQGDNLIDHMDALQNIEDQIDELRSEYLF